jgi:hypothetical protein
MTETTSQRQPRRREAGGKEGGGETATFAGMKVLEQRSVRADLDAVLDDLASGGTEVVALKIDACDPRRLLPGTAHINLRWRGA